MKTTMLVLMISLGVNHLRAQKLKEAEVPAPVKKAFQQHYSAVKDAKWEKEGANYEVEFDLNKAETSVLIDPNGSLLETETELKVAELPKAVSDYITNKLKGQKIKEASKIVDPKGAVRYEAEVGGVDYIFDEKGNFIKKEK
jgi:hypothetical protein